MKPAHDKTATGLDDATAQAETEKLTRSLATDLLRRLQRPGGFEMPVSDDVDQTTIVEALTRMSAIAAMPVVVPPQREVFVLCDGVFVSAMESVPHTSDGRPCCTLCETPLDLPGRPWTRNCGGDCVACMADVGDPDCVAAMPPDGWQPIETAPRDGTLIIAAYYDHPVRPAYWDGTCWMTIGCVTEGGEEPYLWRPLPAPPAITSENADHA